MPPNIFSAFAPDFWAYYLTQESHIVLLLLDRQHHILNMNQGAQQMLGQVFTQNLSLEHWLETESLQRLTALKEGRHPRFRLSFSSPSHPAFSLHCLIEITQEQILIAGENPFYTQENYLEEISALNGDLINTTRDLLREKRQLKTLQQEAEGFNLQLQNHIQQQNTEIKASVDLLEQGRQKIRYLNEKAMIAQEAKAELMRAISHELRTPLNSILGYAQILTKQLPESLSHYAQKIIHSGEQELLYLENMLTMMRSEQIGDFQTENFPLANWLSEKLLFFTEGCQSQEKHFHWSCDEVPEWIEIQRIPFEKLLLRLVDRAREATPPGGSIQLELKSHWFQENWGMTFKIQAPGSLSQEEKELLLKNAVVSPETLNYQAPLLDLMLCLVRAQTLGGNLEGDDTGQNSITLSLPKLPFSGKQMSLQTCVKSTSPTGLAPDKPRPQAADLEKIEQLWQQIKDSLVFNEIESFILTLESWDWQNLTMQHYGQELQKKLNQFELEALASQLLEFPDLLSEWAHQSTHPERVKPLMDAGQAELKTGSLTDLGGKGQFGL